MGHDAELFVIFNPAAGRGRAARRLQALRRSWGQRVTFQPTCHAGHAIELAENAARARYGIVAAAGGDGTVHEVANGLLRARHSDARFADVRFAVLPIGSANDYAHSLQHALGNGRTADGNVAVDVGRVRDPAGREKFFVCCLGLGLNGAVTMESRRIRRLQGIALYGVATLRALWYHYACPTLDLTIDGDHSSMPTLMLSVLVGRREGGFVLAPRAELADGWMEYVHAGALTRFEVLQFLPRLALFGPPAAHPKVRMGRCRSLTLRSPIPLTVHVDGEFFCVPKDDVHELAIDVLPAALTVNLDFLE